MGIRKKIFFGFVIIGFILFLSGLISIVQLIRIEKSASGIISNNISSIDITVDLINLIEEHSDQVSQVMIDKRTGVYARLQFNEKAFLNLIKMASENITVPGEEKIIDTLRVNYDIFKYNTLALDSLFALPNVENRSDWYNNYYKPSLLAFTSSVKSLNAANQEAIRVNSLQLENNFYHMIMPLIIAICAGMFLIGLFNYFIKLYFINPVLAIQKGIDNYITKKSPYSVKVDTDDEIGMLNEDVKLLISQSKRKDTRGVFNLNKP